MCERVGENFVSNLSLSLFHSVEGGKTHIIFLLLPFGHFALCLCVCVCVWGGGGVKQTDCEC